MTSTWPDAPDNLDDDIQGNEPWAPNHVQHHNALAAAVNALEAHALTKTGPSSGLVRSPLPGERTYVMKHESATIQSPKVAPAGVDKEIILARVKGRPGILNHVWLTLRSAQVWAHEDLGRIRVYIDDEDTPELECSVAEFFLRPWAADPFYNERVTHLVSGYGGDPYTSGQSRIFEWPWQGFMKIAYAYTDEDNALGAALWSTVNYSILDAPGSRNGYGRYKQIVTNADRDTLEAFDVAAFEGEGVLDHLFFEVLFPDDSRPAGWLEGNAQLLLNGAAHPSVSYSGNEDLADGSFYVMREGAFPTGYVNGTHDAQGKWSMAIWKHFTDTPVFFQEDALVRWMIGQHGQSDSIANQVWRAITSVGAWLKELPVPSYHAEGAVLFEDSLEHAAGDFPAPWSYPGVHVIQAAGVGQPAVVTQPLGWDAPVRYPIPAGDFMAQVSARILASQTDAGEVFLSLGGGSTFFGDCISSNFKRNSQYDWVVKQRWGFEEPCVDLVSDGADLADVWVDLAIERIGTRITTLWRFTGETEWRALASMGQGSFTLTHIELNFWTCQAEFKDFKVVELS